MTEFEPGDRVQINFTAKVKGRWGTGYDLVLPDGSTEWYLTERLEQIATKIEPTNEERFADLPLGGTFHLLPPNVEVKPGMDYLTYIKVGPREYIMARGDNPIDNLVVAFPIGEVDEVYRIVATV